MAISGPSSGGDEDSPITDINTTPLVDVMLVLLIIFLITIPVVIQTVPVSLPKVSFEATTTKPENVSLSIKGDNAGGCEIYWGLKRVNSEELLDMAVAKLEADVKKAGGAQNITEENMPEVHIRGDVNTPYKCVGGAQFLMQSAGFSRIGFISEPPAGTAVVRS